MSNLEICPVCCEGKLHPYFFSKELKYKNVRCCPEIFASSKCDVCEASIATNAQTKANKLLVVNFQRASDGLLTTHEIFRIRKKLNLSQRAASAIVGGGGNSFSKYESGAVRQSTSIDNILRVLDKKPATLEILREAEQLRKALSSGTTEFCIPPLSVAARSEGTVISFLKEMVSAAQTVFSSPLDDISSYPAERNKAISFNFISESRP